MALLSKRVVNPRHFRPPGFFGALEETSRDPWFNPYRVPATKRAWSVVKDVAGQLHALEEYRKARQRKRRPADSERFDAIVAAVVADLTHHYLSGSPGAGLVVTRSKKVLAKGSRHRPSILTEIFVAELDLLAAPEMDFISQTIGGRNQREAWRTTVKAGSRLITRIQDHQLSFADLDVAEREEVILLKGRRRVKDDGREDFFDRADLVEYEDNLATMQYRAEVETINAWLKNADIAFDKDAAKRGLSEPALIHTIEHVDAKSRQLRRYFSRGSFESGGRLFGGFWQQLERQSRLRGLRINGQPVVSLDYSQFNPMLAYSIAKKIPPAGDAYTLLGLEPHRERVKRVFNAMMFSRLHLRSSLRGYGRLQRLESRRSAMNPSSQM